LLTLLDINGSEIEYDEPKMCDVDCRTCSVWTSEGEGCMSWCWQCQGEGGQICTVFWTL